MFSRVPAHRETPYYSERMEAGYNSGANSSRGRPESAPGGRHIIETAKGVKKGFPFKNEGRGQHRGKGPGRGTGREASPMRPTKQGKMSLKEIEESQYFRSSPRSKPSSFSNSRRRRPNSESQGAPEQVHTWAADRDRLVTIGEMTCLNEEEEHTGIIKRITRTISGSIHKMRLS